MLLVYTIYRSREDIYSYIVFYKPIALSSYLYRNCIYIITNMNQFFWKKKKKVQITIYEKESRNLNILL